MRLRLVVVALSTLVAAIAILVFQSWSKVVFLMFGLAMAVLARPGTRRTEVVGMALAIGGSAALGGVGLYLIGASSFADAVLCTTDPCPALGLTLLLTGTAALIVAALAVAALVWNIRQRGRAPLLLPAVNVLLVGLFAVLLIQGAESGSALVEIAGLAATASVLRLAPARPRLLQAAVFAQAADLSMFGFAWQLGQGEQNPLGRWTIEALLALGPTNASWEAAAAAGLILILAKLALVGFLIRITPQLGRYRRAVLLTATLAGTVGAAGTVLVRLP